MPATAQQVAQKWRDRLSASTTQITEGVNAVTVAPGQKAAAAKQLWLQRVTASQDKWATNVARVSLQDWQNAMITVGIPRVATGAQAKVGKVESFMNEFLPFVHGKAEIVRGMPKGTLDQSIARSSAMIQAMATFRRGR